MKNAGSPQDAPRTYVQVIDYIKKEIASGHLHVGSKLPPERVLAETLNVSRNSVREALRILEIMGTTVSIQGSGHFISNHFETTIMETLSMMFMLKELSFKEISELRYALEMRALVLAMHNASEEDLAELQEIISHLDSGLSETENVILDKRLHYTIARASGNTIFVEILQALSDIMDRFIADLRQDLLADEVRKEKLFDAHRRMVNCILRKDIIGGYSAIQDHFELINQRLEARTGFK